MTAIDDAIDRSRDQVRSRASLSAEPRRRLAVLTCMDARLDPLDDLGLACGDAHVIRNAGGRATDDALRSLLLSWHALGTREVLVIHHTRCGVRADDEDALRTRLADVSGADLADVALHTFADDEQAVADDVARIRAVPYAPDGLVVVGAIHDLDAGTLRRV